MDSKREYYLKRASQKQIKKAVTSDFIGSFSSSLFIFVIQGKGYGSRLLSFLEQELQMRKIHSLFLITEKNEVARKFYGGKGYSVNEDRIIMRKTF